MIVVVPGAAWWHQRGLASRTRVRVRFTQAVPWFVIGFLALALGFAAALATGAIATALIDLVAR